MALSPASHFSPALSGLGGFLFRSARKIREENPRSGIILSMQEQPVSGHHIRQTKVVATLGPATESAEMISHLIAAGANVFRLNMSHAKHDWVRTVVPRIREAAESAGRHVAILMDTQGPSIRTGEVEEDLELKPGDILELRTRGTEAKERYSVDSNYDGLIGDLSVGDTVLLDNGVLHLQVKAKDSDRARCEVLTEGTLTSRRHINLPGVKVNLPALTEKDLEDLALAAEMQADFIALSFVRDRAHIVQLRGVLDGHGSRAQIIAKIEDQSAVKNLAAITEEADGVMVARGDLGVECDLEELPILQRHMVSLCIRRGKPVIVATHMLESMIENPRPTRAEVADVAYAVAEQADAVMLSGETSIGRYPVKCVEMLVRISRRIEISDAMQAQHEVDIRTTKQKTAQAAVILANSIERSHLVIFTKRGSTARAMASLRPDHAQIQAFTPSPLTARHVTLLRGVRAHVTEFSDTPSDTVRQAMDHLKKEGIAHPGDSLVIISDVLSGEENLRVEAIQLRVVQ